MNTTPPPVPEPLPGDDLRSLAWVHTELQRSLEQAHKALQRQWKEAQSLRGSDVSAVDPAVLYAARAQLHQGVGALELVGMAGPAALLRASEAAVARMAARPSLLDAKSLRAVESASFALLDYLGRVLAGKRMSALSLFAQYKAVQELAGADRIHPADLWAKSWAWRELPSDTTVEPRLPDAATRQAMEAQTLVLMRGANRMSMLRMSELSAGLGAASNGQLGTLWKLAAAFFEAQACALLLPDVYSKRVASRLLAQLRATMAGKDEVSERLAQDLLFFCAHAREPNAEFPAPRLAAVRQVYELGDSARADYQQPSLGRFDPAWLMQAKKRVATAKDVWSSVAAAETHRLPNLQEQFALVGDSLKRLYPQGEKLAAALEGAARGVLAQGSPPQAPLAMEVATALLYLEASLEEADLDHPELGPRVARMAQRIESVAQGRDSQALEPWMEELYRRVSDRQTMGSVVQELRAALSEVEKQVDQYFRNPADNALLLPVPGQLQSMQGVLSVLDLPQAGQAVRTMREEVEALAVDADPSPEPGRFDRLADNLGALSFLIDMLAVQPALAKTLFQFDTGAGVLRIAISRAERLSGFGALDGAPLAAQAQALAQQAARPEVGHEFLLAELEQLSQQALMADQGELAAAASQARAALARADTDAQRSGAREALSRSLAAFAGAALPPAPAPVPQAPVRQTPPPLPSVQGSTGLEADAEMRSIFIDEAREVLQGAQQALGRLADSPQDLADLSAVRRAFHTLKGSARMVGLQAFGEAAWSCEQLYNARLAQDTQLDPPLQQFTQEALRYLGGWVGAIADDRHRGHQAAPVNEAADALRLHGQRLPLPEPADAAQTLAERVPGLPAATDLDLSPALPTLDLDLDASPAPAAAPVRSALEPLSFDFPLDGDVDAPAPAPAPAAATAEEALPVPEPADTGMAATLVLPTLDVPVLDEELPATAADAVAFDLLLPDLPDAAPLAAAAPDTPQPLAEGLSVEEDSQLSDADFDLAFDPAAPAVPAADQAPLEADADPEPEPEPFKQIGPLRVSLPLFNIFLNEADEQSRRLSTELAEWALESQRPVSEEAVVMAHSLAGSSATVGYVQLSGLARALEHALMRTRDLGHASPGEPQLFCDVAEEVRHLLHQFAAGFLKPVSPELLQRLQEHEQWHVSQPLPLADAAPAPSPALQPAAPQPEPATPALPALPALPGGLPSLGLLRELPVAAPLLQDVAATDFEPDDIDALDQVDAELFPIFKEEAEELLPQLSARMREWAAHPGEMGAASACMRTLHTFKGGARLAGAMRLGEMAHRLEAAIEHLVAAGHAETEDVERLQARADALSAAFETVQPTPAAADAAAAPVVVPSPVPSSAASTAASTASVAAPPAPAPVAPLPLAAAAVAAAAPTVIDWGRFKGSSPVAVEALQAERLAASQAAVRVRAPLLDRLVNQAGEVSITRSRIETDVGQIKNSLADLNDNLERLRTQLREVELQADSQIASRLEAAKVSQQNFDPLEMDRFTRLQELTRMMAESVNDVATVQRGLQRSLQATEDELAAQMRLTRDLQDGLLRTRMVEFDGLADRLYRVVRLAAKETGKQVRLDIVGGRIEVDRSVLERMTGPFEHLLRNSVSHGIESVSEREAAGKDATGTITVHVSQEGNEVAVECRDDGAGLNLARIRERAVAQGLLQADAQPSDAALADLIFTPGFSTASSITELSGRGVGMDVVRAEVVAMGGRIETASTPGRGASFRLVLPLTTAVTQVLMVRAGELSVAIPSTLVESMQRIEGAALAQAYDTAAFGFEGSALPFFWLGALLDGSPRGGAHTGESEGDHALLVIRSAQQRVALHVDQVLGNQEVVVKHLGPQLARLPGLAGMTLLPSGSVALIYNPVALAGLYGEVARERMRGAPSPAAAAGRAAAAPRTPLVMVVDDSLTVRRVTERLLQREGYRVLLAKDGMEALERLGGELPSVVLSDIEMPRMDGFDLVRNLRADRRLATLPVIMITSRIAQKHRDYAAELGVRHYLGKPYAEEELLALIARYARDAAVAA